jgi:hypothetical protein
VRAAICPIGFACPSPWALRELRRDKSSGQTRRSFGYFQFLAPNLPEFRHQSRNDALGSSGRRFMITGSMPRLPYRPIRSRLVDIPAGTLDLNMKSPNEAWHDDQKEIVIFDRKSSQAALEAERELILNLPTGRPRLTPRITWAPIQAALALIVHARHRIWGRSLLGRI